MAEFPFMRMTILIYCISIGAYFVSLSGWAGMPSFDIPFINTGRGMTLPGGASPVINLPGWEIVQAFLMILILVPLAPIYIGNLFVSLGIPLAYVIMICAPLTPVYVFGLAKFLRRGEG